MYFSVPVLQLLKFWLFVTDQSVLNSRSLWFINFYSDMCSHCHELAPTWRQLARELEGVIRIGAVNCEDDWVLCHQEGIRSYPSLFVYPAVSFYDYLCQ